MPKGPKVIRDALQDLKEYRDSLSPQRGFFSTLDKLIEEAPFERGSADQWRGYLKPGRMYKREGLQFPLKQEELDYALDPALEADLAKFSHESISREDLLKLIRSHRPSFGLQIGSEEFSSASRDRKAASGRIAELEKQLSDIGDSTRMRLGPERYGPNSDFDDEGMRLSHTSPFSSYEESATTLGGYDYSRQHFSHDTVTHSRASSHEIPDVGGGRARLVEEIQSDAHQDAATRPKETWREHLDEEDRADMSRLEDDLADITDGRRPSDPLSDRENAEVDRIEGELKVLRARGESQVPRRGYSSKDTLTKLAELERYPDENYYAEAHPEITPEQAYDQYRRLKKGVPDAPFKSPAEYGRLELRKQLLNAVREDEKYLAITTGDDQVSRYSLKGKDAEGMRHVYDEVYRGELEKLAKQYGAEVKEIELPVGSLRDVRPPSMRDNGFETVNEFMEVFEDEHPHSNMMPHLLELIDDLEPGSPPMAKQLKAQATDLDAVMRGKDEQMKGDALDAFTDNLRQLFDDYSDKARITDQFYGNSKKFPAIQLTPEVKKRIREAGVPLWSAAGAGSLLELGRDLPQDVGDDREEFAEGGAVEGEDVDATVSQLENLLARTGQSFGEQWTGLDDHNQVKGAIYSDFDAPQDEWQFNSEAGMALPPQRTVTPGIFRDTVSLPAQFGYSGPGSDYMLDQLAELEAQDAIMMDEAGLSEPHGFLEHGAHALGTMLGQVPVPGSTGKKAATGFMARARKILGAPIEWLSPTIHPTAGNYATGAMFGALQEAVPEAVSEHFARAKASNRMRADIENLSPEKRAEWDALVEEIEDHLRENTSAE